MKIMIYSLIFFVLFSCNNSKICDENYELFIINKNYKQELSIVDKNLNVNVYYEDKPMINLVIKMDSTRIIYIENSLKEMSIKNRSTEKSSVLIKSKNIKSIYLKNDEFLKSTLENLDRFIQLTKKLNDVTILKVNAEIESNNFEKAFKLAEMSVYQRRPFYKGFFKDDRKLKVLSQKALFDNGRKREAIKNLLHLN